jgi:hypothetical protein
MLAWSYQPGPSIGYLLKTSYQPGLGMGPFKNIHTSLVLLLGPILFFGWHEIGIYLILN